MDDIRGFLEKNSQLEARNKHDECSLWYGKTA
jgi:hypothetical protein